MLRSRRSYQPFIQFVYSVVHLAIMIVLASPLSSALEFEMTKMTKCIVEEISADVLAVGEYQLTRKDGLFVSGTVTVTDPSGATVVNQRSTASSQFAFTSKLAGDYQACFTVQDVATAEQTKIRLDWNTGVSATDWEEVAKKENLDVMATELRKLEQMVKEIHSEMLFLKKTEEEMRNLNEATNERVAWFSISSLLVCAVLGAWQLWHLRQFFKRKKIL
eukprot:jgi/Ulvmu1/4695/UM002_0426.1